MLAFEAAMKIFFRMLMFSHESFKFDVFMAVNTPGLLFF